MPRTSSAERLFSRELHFLDMIVRFGIADSFADAPRELHEVQAEQHERGG